MATFVLVIGGNPKHKGAVNRSITPNSEMAFRSADSSPLLASCSIRVLIGVSVGLSGKSSAVQNSALKSLPFAGCTGCDFLNQPVR